MTNPGNGGCDWFAAMSGWEILKKNVLVEGTSDVRYLKLANSLYFKKTGYRLIGIDMAVCAVGEKDDGGTYGMMDKFPTITTISKLHKDINDKQIYRFIALLDDDSMGRSALKNICSSRRDIREFEHIFRLRRRMPLRAGNIVKLAERTNEENACFNMDCVIEDLLPIDICTEFVRSDPHRLNPTPVSENNGHHTRWPPERKSQLLRYTEEHAIYNDMLNIISLIKSLRSYLNLSPDGIKV